MKPFIKRLLKIVAGLAIVGLIGFGALYIYFVRNVKFTRICLDEPAAIARIQGEYPSEVFLAALKSTRSLDAAFKAEYEVEKLKASSEPTAVSVGTRRILLSFVWHEGEDAKCVKVREQTLRLHGSKKKLYQNR